MTLYAEKSACCGCTACQTLCPAQAIDMRPDAEGFLYPHIDAALCAHCGQCRQACAFQRERHSGNASFPQTAYAARHTDRETLEKSSSGGVFSALAAQIFAQDGVLYGVCFSENHLHVIHARAESGEAMRRMRGSKYVQSDLRGCYAAICDDLAQNIPVLFTGTPCQVDGLRAVVAARGLRDAPLCCCDFICHGVSSPVLWQQYVCWLEQKFGDTLTDFSFRSKARGWREARLRVTIGEKDKSEPCNASASYLTLYTSAVATRPCCYACPYASYDRVADITLGDFWNIGHIIPQMNDDRGVSSVLINTQRGQALFAKAAAQLDVRAVTPKDCWTLHLSSPVAQPSRRSAFWTLYAAQGAEAALERYTAQGVAQRAQKRVLRLARRIGLYGWLERAYIWSKGAQKHTKQ